MKCQEAKKMSKSHRTCIPTHCTRKLKYQNECPNQSKLQARMKILVNVNI